MNWFLLLLSVLIAPFAAGQKITHPSQTLADPAYAQAIQKARRLVDSLRTQQGIPGLSVCVGTRDKLLWAEAFGLADVENQTPLTVQSRFRMGSVSKSITSLALGKLVQDGRLNPDAPLETYFRGFPPKRYPVTARQLASHTAGIRHYGPRDGLECLRRYPTVEEGLAIFAADSLLFRPGTAYHYSTYGYTLLSVLLEKASQTPFLTYLQTAIFTPLGMQHTGADHSDRIEKNRVRFYERRNGQLVNAAQVENSYKWAGGGLLSTPGDLVIMSAGLMNHTLLKQQTVELLFKPTLLADGTNTQYGLGWRIGQDRQQRRLIHHGGSIDGGRTFLLIYPDANLSVAIAANMLEGTNLNLPELEAIAGYFLQRTELR